MYNGVLYYFLLNCPLLSKSDEFFFYLAPTDHKKNKICTKKFIHRIKFFLRFEKFTIVSKRAWVCFLCKSCFLYPNFNKSGNNISYNIIWWILSIKINYNFSAFLPFVSDH